MSPEQEDQAVLAELDWMIDTLRTGPGAAPEEPEPLPRVERLVPAPPVAEPEPAAEEERGSPSPYLEERLTTAQEVASVLSLEFERMERRSVALQGAVRTLEGELHRASEEIAFLRSADAYVEEPPRAAPAPLERPDREPERAPADLDGSPDPAGDPPYDQFTVERYNGIVRALVARRRKLAATTLGLAVLISAALLTVTLLWREPVPPLWILAGLPAIWLVPVPFFITSFRGTHRVLAHEPLELPEAP